MPHRSWEAVGQGQGDRDSNEKQLVARQALPALLRPGAQDPAEG